MGIKFNFNVNINKKFNYNGREYNSLEEMPPEVREIFEKNLPKITEAMKEAENKPPEEKKTKDGVAVPQLADEEEEYEDELEGKGENLLEKKPGRESIIYADILKPQKTANPAWYYGILIISVISLLLGALILMRSFGAHLKILNILNIAGLAFVILGVGMMERRKWARVLMLVYAPFAGLIVYMVMIKGVDGRFYSFLQGLMAFLAVTFVYLLLPWVAGEFSGKIKVLRQELRMANLVLPPREVPFSLKLSIIFGESFTLASLGVLAGVFLTGIIQVKRMVGGFTFNILKEPVLSLVYLVPLGFFIFFPIVLWMNTKAGMSFITLLENGMLAHAVLVRKVLVSSHDAKVYRLYFEYEIGGKKYKLWEDSSKTAPLEDEAKEPLIYDLKKPGHAMLLDSLPAHITVDDMGKLKHRDAWTGYFYLSLPVILALAVLYFTFK